MTKKAIVMGATSGIGMEVAKLLAAKGWQVGIAGRRTERLQALMTDGIACYQQIDVTSADAPHLLQQLIDKLGGMDLYFSQFRNRMAEQSARYRERTEDGGNERNGIHKNGRHRIQLVCCPRPGKREETQLSHCLHHIHSRNKRTWCCPSLFCHQTIPKPLLGMPCPASKYAPASHLDNRHTARICGNRPDCRQQISATAKSRRSGKAHRTCH